MKTKLKKEKRKIRELGIFLKRKRHKVNFNSRDTFFKSQQISII